MVGPSVGLVYGVRACLAGCGSLPPPTAAGWGSAAQRCGRYALLLHTECHYRPHSSNYPQGFIPCLHLVPRKGPVSHRKGKHEQARPVSVRRKLMRMHVRRSVATHAPGAGYGHCGVVLRMRHTAKLTSLSNSL